MARTKKKLRAIRSPPIISYHSGFFDGATNSSIGGVGFSLAINQSHSFLFKMGCGPSTNTRVELLALWDLLFIAIAMGFPSLYVCGDSSVVINWAKSEATLSAMNLDYWCDKIIDIKLAFLSLDFRHIYREHNKSAH